MQVAFFEQSQEIVVLEHIEDADKVVITIYTPSHAIKCLMSTSLTSKDSLLLFKV